MYKTFQVYTYTLFISRTFNYRELSDIGCVFFKTKKILSWVGKKNLTDAGVGVLVWHNISLGNSPPSPAATTTNHHKKVCVLRMALDLLSYYLDSCLY